MLICGGELVFQAWISTLFGRLLRADLYDLETPEVEQFDGA
jgi:hypothetical protein